MTKPGTVMELTTPVEGHGAGTRVVVVENGWQLPTVKPEAGGDPFFCPAGNLKEIPTVTEITETYSPYEASIVEGALREFADTKGDYPQADTDTARTLAEQIQNNIASNVEEQPPSMEVGRVLAIKDDQLTIGEMFDAVGILAREGSDAQIKEWLDAQVEKMRRDGVNEDVRRRPEEVVKANIGYVVGYSNDPEFRKRVYDRFGTAHPIFGYSAMVPADEERERPKTVRRAEQVAPDHLRVCHTCGYVEAPPYAKSQMACGHGISNGGGWTLMRPQNPEWQANLAKLGVRA